MKFEVLTAVLMKMHVVCYTIPTGEQSTLTPKLEAASYAKTSVSVYQSTLHLISKGLNLHM